MNEAGWIEEFSSLEDIRSRYPTVACGRLGLVLAEGRSPRLVVDSSISGVTEACFIPNRMLLPRIADIALCAPVHCVQEEYGFSCPLIFAKLTDCCSSTRMIKGCSAFPLRADSSSPRL